MALLGGGMLTNENMYQKTWSSFVDGVISKHQQEENGADGEGGVQAGRIELRDVMCLEEVLAKLEKAEGGWIDYEARPPAAGDDDMETESSSLCPVTNDLLRRNDRQQLPGLPPMFENPRPFFLVSMYKNPASAQAVGEGEHLPPSPPPPPRLDSQRSGRCTAPDPGGNDPSRSHGAPREGRQQPSQGGRQSGGEAGAGADTRTTRDDSPTRARSSPSPSWTGALAPLDAVGRAAVDGPNIFPAFEGVGIVPGGGNVDDQAVAVYEGEDRNGSESLRSGSAGEEADNRSSSPESLPRAMKALPLDEPTARPAACSLSEPSLQSPGGVAVFVSCTPPPPPEPSPEDVGLPRLHPRLESAHIGKLGGAGGSLGSIDGEEREKHPSPGLSGRKPDLLRASVIIEASPSRSSCGGGAEDERPPRAPSEEESGEVVGVATLEPSQCSNGKGFDGTALAAPRGEDDDAPGVVGGNQDPSDSSSPPAASGRNECTAGDDFDGGMIPPGVEIEPQNVAAAAAAAAAENSGSGRVLSVADESFCARDSSVVSGLTSTRPSNAGSPRVGNCVADSGTSGDGRISESPHRPRGGGGDRARAHDDAESPEILRLGSASLDPDGVRRDSPPSFDRGSWGAGATAAGDGGLDGGEFRLESNSSSHDAGAIFDLAQSPDEAPSADGREPEGFGSMLSPGAQGSGTVDDGGGGGVDSLSLALVGPLDETGGAFGGGDGDGGGRDLGEGMGDYGGLSPVRSARSECTAASDDDDEEEEDGDITLTPEISRTSRIYASQSRFATGDGGSGEAEDCEREHTRADASSVGVGEGVDSRGLMPPPPPRQPSLTPCRKGRPHPETPEARRLSSSPRRGCSPFGDRASTNTANTYGGGRYGGCSEDEGSLSDRARADESGGRGRGVSGDCNESIGSFSEGENKGGRSLGSGVGGSFRGGGSEGEGGDEENADSSLSLVEGTPRRRKFSPGKSLGGFYPPLQVTNVVKREKKPPGLSLSTLQRSTLQWMLWREGGEEGGRHGGRTSRTAAAASFSDDDAAAADVDVKGGVLGHLSAEDASTCVHALVQGQAAVSDDAAGKKADRGRPAHAGTGLPRGATLVVAQTKEAAWRWSDRLEAGADGLSVLSYVMPLRERRRLSATQAAAFDVVVTTYDVLKSKEVPRGVEAKEDTSPRSWALPGSKQWRARNTSSKENWEGHRKPAASSKTDHMVSLLHGVWWDRVVADGAQILANQRSARAVAALSLVGHARWCVVERENMTAVENSSERMRCLASFLRIPAEVAMVDVAENLFYPSRPSHVAPLHPRTSGDADNSLSLSMTEGDGGASSPDSFRRKRRPLSRRSSSSVNVGGRAGGPRSRVGVKGKQAPEEDRREGFPAQRGHGSGLLVTEKEGRRRSSRVTMGTGSPGNREGFGGRKAAGAGVPSREDVTYATKTLRLRRARGEGGPVGVGQKR